MNASIQYILVFGAVGFAVFYLIRKFFFKKSKSNKACGGGDDCGCH